VSTPVELADTGPELEDRVPRSLATSDATELDVRLDLISGTLPTDWSGHGFITHPVPFTDGTPVFMGDGKILRLDFGPDGVDLKSRIARTPCHYVDVATLTHKDGFENNGMARMSMTLGFRNFPNTAVVALDDRLLLTSDAGRPWEIDPETLELVTPMGRNDEWTGILPSFLGIFVDWVFELHMTTAHPAVDHETQELFTVNYGIPIVGDTFTNLVRWRGHGNLDTWEVVDLNTGAPVQIAQSVHQLAITRDHIILMDTAFLVEVAVFGDDPDAIAQHPDSLIYIIRRSDLGSGPVVPARRVVMPRESVHFMADFDDRDGIVLHVAHSCAADPSEWLRADDVLADGSPVDPDLVGLPCAPTDLGAWGRYVLDRDTGTLIASELRYDERWWGGPALVAMRGPELRDRYHSLFWANAGISRELRLQRIERLYADYPYREVALSELPEEPSSLVHIHADTGEVADHYPFPAGRVCLSPVFVPRDGSTDDDDGYLVCTVISDAGDELWVFDAANLGQGPLARLGHPDLNLPFTLHTLWVPSVAPRTATYAVDIRADYAASVRKLPTDLQQVFEDDVYPHFS
jgi:carotenoid cleavage dioxygenase-like enzyme